MLDQKSIFLPLGKRKREKEKREAEGETKVRGKILLGSGAWLHLKAYELLQNRPGRSLPFSTLFSKLQPSACEACLASGALHMLFPPCGKSCQPDSLPLVPEALVISSGKTAGSSPRLK